MSRLCFDITHPPRNSTLQIAEIAGCWRHPVGLDASNTRAARGSEDKVETAAN